MKRGLPLLTVYSAAPNLMAVHADVGTVLQPQLHIVENNNKKTRTQSEHDGTHSVDRLMQAILQLLTRGTGEGIGSKKERHEAGRTGCVAHRTLASVAGAVSHSSSFQDGEIDAYRVADLVRGVLRPDALPTRPKEYQGVLLYTHFLTIRVQNFLEGCLSLHLECQLVVILRTPSNL